MLLIAEEYDFFLESSYADTTGRELPCFQVTRKGCEFIANKLTGQKGTLFTAAYIDRFHEMECGVRSMSAKEHGCGEVASLLKVITTEMHKGNLPQDAIIKQVHLTCMQFGIRTISELTQKPPYEQMQLSVSHQEGFN